MYTYIYEYIYMHIFIYVHLYDDFGTILVKCNQNYTVTLASRYNQEICYSIRQSNSSNSDLNHIARKDHHFPTRYIYNLHIFIYTYMNMYI